MKGEFIMLNWIEQAGGKTSVAAAVAPVIRSLSKNEYYPLVSFQAESEENSAGTAVNKDVLFIDISGTADLSGLLGLLQKSLSEGHGYKKIILAGFGSFLLTLPGTTARGNRLHGKVALVTGGAQGFGEGIARELAAAGAHVVIADLNLPQAEVVAASLNAVYGPAASVALSVDVGQEASVLSLMENIVLLFGGLDLLVSNAGVLRAGGLEEMTLSNFEFVTKINYTAFFIVVKYGSRPMKIQARYSPAYYSDIVQVNSKSGLEGSNKNFAYAGGKFGGIGLVQSFAKELVEDRIKVNAVCPGNFYEGPLWSDPDRGLFVQYLNTGKVPGAKTVQEVYDFYVGKVPMRRGCSPVDVTRAITYCVEQLYETGQAIPVTGGQNMLN